MTKLPDPENQPQFGGEGIYASMSILTGPCRLLVEPLYATSPTGMLIESRNEFYDCHWGVLARDYFQVQSHRSKVISTQDVAAAPNLSFGFDVVSGLFDRIDLSNNEIYNVESGIKVASQPTYTVSVSPVLYPIGFIEVNKNQIHATIGPPYPAPTSQYVQNGIHISQTVTGAPGYFTPVYAYTHSDDNNMTDVYRGITVLGSGIFPEATHSNTITVTRDNTPYSVSFGIDHIFCYGSEIMFNQVKGADPSAMAISSTGQLPSGIVAESSSKTHICTNATDAVMRGFEFKGNNAGTNWTDNTMSNNLQGMVLNDAMIGPQGDPTNAMNNDWAGPGYWTGFPFGPWQTYVIKPTPPCYSPLFFVTPGTTDPNVNGGFPMTYSYTAMSSTCSSSILNPATFGGAMCASVLRPAAHEAVARQITYAADNNARNWVLQSVLWNALLFDTVLIDSSVVLDSFKSRASISRFAYLSNIEAALAFGDTTLADSLLTASPASVCSLGLGYDPVTGARVKDDATVDYLVNNQKQFYKLWLHRLKGTWCTSDAAQLDAIADECPALYGPVVYRARMLHSLVHNRIKVWADTCGGDSSYNMRQMPSATDAVVGVEQQYHLLPNPNDGNITLLQMIEDSGPVGVEVCDVVGRNVFKGIVEFRESTYSLHLKNLTPGIYLMKIKDNKERLFNFRFVVQ